MGEEVSEFSIFRHFTFRFTTSMLYAEVFIYDMQ